MGKALRVKFWNSLALVCFCYYILVCTVVSLRTLPSKNAEHHFRTLLHLHATSDPSVDQYAQDNIQPFLALPFHRAMAHTRPFLGTFSLNDEVSIPSGIICVNNTPPLSLAITLAALPAIMLLFWINSHNGLIVAFGFGRHRNESFDRYFDDMKKKLDSRREKDDRRWTPSPRSYLWGTAALIPGVVVGFTISITFGSYSEYMSVGVSWRTLLVVHTITTTLSGLPVFLGEMGIKFGLLRMNIDVVGKYYDEILAVLLSIVIGAVVFDNALGMTASVAITTVLFAAFAEMDVPFRRDAVRDA